MNQNCSNTYTVLRLVSSIMACVPDWITLILQPFLTMGLNYFWVSIHTFVHVGFNNSIAKLQLEWFINNYQVKMHLYSNISKWEWSLRNYLNPLCILSSLHRANDNICLNLHVLVPCATMGIWGWGVVYYYWYYPVDICN